MQQEKIRRPLAASIGVLWAQTKFYQISLRTLHHMTVFKVTCPINVYISYIACFSSAWGILW